MVDHNVPLPPVGNTRLRQAAPFMPGLLGLVVVVAIGVFGYLTQSGIRNSKNWVLHSYAVRASYEAWISSSPKCAAQPWLIPFRQTQPTPTFSRLPRQDPRWHGRASAPDHR